MNLDRFVQSQVRSLQRTPRSAPRAADCWEIESVARGSVAQWAALQPGDRVCRVDGESARQLRCGPVPQAQEWVFHAHAQGEEVTLQTSGIDPGLRVRPTVENVVACFDPHSHDYRLLLRLWEAGRWKDLERLCRLALAPPTRFWHRLLPAPVESQNSPLLGLLGAALVELGRHDEGIRLLMEFHSRYMQYYTVDLHSVVGYYFGVDAMVKQRPAAAIEILQNSYSQHPWPFTRALLEKLGARVHAPESKWERKPWPLTYELTALDQTGQAELAASLRLLDAHQFLVVCLLAGYRGNGPYNDFMESYRSLSTHFKPYLGELHVITQQPQRDADRPHWYEQEDLAHEEGVPFKVLHDPEGQLAATLEIQASPSLFLIRPDGTVHHQGELQGFDLWEALARS